MIRRTDTRPSTQQPSSSSLRPSGKKHKQPTPNSAADIGGYSASGPRVSAYRGKGVDPFPPPGMPTPRDRDSEKIVYRDSPKYSVANNPPLPTSRAHARTPHSADAIGQGLTASSKRTSIYDSLNVNEHLPPGLPSARDRDSEKIVYSDSPKYAVANNPPLATSRVRAHAPHSADVIGQGLTASSKRTSIYDSLDVRPHQPPGVPSPRDRDSEKIVYQDYSTLHAVSDNPPASSSRSRPRIPHSADAIGQGLTASSKRTSVYDSFNVRSQPPGMPSARDRDSEKIVYNPRSTRANTPPHTSRMYRAELEARPVIPQADSRPLYELPGSYGGVELPTDRSRR